MRLKRLTDGDLAAVLSLFCEVFAEDAYYAAMYGEGADLAACMHRDFAPSISYGLRGGLSLGVYEGDRLMAFLIACDYRALMADPAAAAMIFGTGHRDENDDEKQAFAALREGIAEVPTLYGLSLGVSAELRGAGMGSLLVDRLIEENPGCALISDVSNAASLGIYRARGFRLTEIAAGYTFVYLPAGGRTGYPYPERVRVAVADPAVLSRELGLSPTLLGRRFVPDAAIADGALTLAPGEIAEATLLEMSYHDLLVYQRYLGILDYNEIDLATAVAYVRHRAQPHFDPSEEENRALAEGRAREWSAVPDIFLSIPVTYQDTECFAGEGSRPATEGSAVVDAILANLEFRTTYEAGIAAGQLNDDGAVFKSRIHRVSLGAVTLSLCDESTLGDRTCRPIGKPHRVELYLSYDSGSSCGVVGLASLSCPFMMSVFFDNVSRNQILVTEGDKSVNLYDYLSDRFALTKSGTPRIFAVLPHERGEVFTDAAIGSLLSGETIYADGENFGEIIDSEILSLVRSQYGLGQYNRGCVLAYRNVVLQFDGRLRASLADRVAEEIITQFYIELVEMEDAAINMTDAAIVELLAETTVSDPVEYLETVEKIHEKYAKTVCFWDVLVNYPTSQKSIEMLRRAFCIDRQVERMTRNREQMRAVFEAKCEIIDRNDSRRVDTSLAILAVLAVFGALIDCYDFIGVWEGPFASIPFLILQILFTAGIFATGVYAVLHMLLRKKRRARRKK